MDTTIKINQFNEKVVTKAREAGFTDKQIIFLTETFEFIREVK
jgi:hypothetical protein